MNLIVNTDLKRKNWRIIMFRTKSFVGFVFIGVFATFGSGWSSVDDAVDARKPGRKRAATVPLVPLEAPPSSAPRIDPLVYLLHEDGANSWWVNEDGLPFRGNSGPISSGDVMKIKTIQTEAGVICFPVSNSKKKFKVK
ncbi:MAG: hypothetical protein A2977_03830 [Alphaproteobacteria bacterium RIFCSPLOWO2_01_FULL_45_8]|nr:MAG: hypothetical protein A2065_04760 [Alphaproteobacteria bacterium GWB1_45_5]OFW76514.1 MAG: hypothetical protein A3K20_04640 [Alphaproteobacteria bacterium GWA1_45_9]OFW90314.1 MAG: hypothetical protein A2621_04990 [Alphaproteobacteria bacterium RIFCSPHIGHO2_01_FULL_41_14]OFW95768.1 MAG: hypothetical protein A2977_03830 [Alphaproteobacteria bacterium RIFCSPLOWO2_01_FULL_45_8]HCI48613.1 hypothetical protein [Holosporales bacterium]